MDRDIVMTSIEQRFNASIIGIGGCLQLTTIDLWCRAASRAINYEYQGDARRYLQEMLRQTRRTIELSGGEVPSEIVASRTDDEWFTRQVEEIKSKGAYYWALDFVERLIERNTVS